MVAQPQMARIGKIEKAVIARQRSMGAVDSSIERRLSSRVHWKIRNFHGLRIGIKCGRTEKCPHCPQGMLRS
jgi:hypothetical protein